MGTASMPEVAESRFHVLGRACHLVVGAGEQDAADLLEDARKELQRIESLFSPVVESSLIYQLNHSTPGTMVALTPEARSLIDYILALRRRTGHVFDPTIGPVLRLWSSSNGQPTEVQLEDALARMGWEQFTIEGDSIGRTVKQVNLNLNVVICPYAVDSVRRLLRKAGVTSALIDLDKDIATIGKQPDGANWLVGIRHPRGQRTGIQRLKLNDRSYSLRGNFERRIMLGEEAWSRAFSPVDGFPVPGPLSVSVIADTCLEACAAATVARYRTQQAAFDWLDEIGADWFSIGRDLHCRGPIAERNNLLTAP